ncbi:uncharacterized protein LOC122264660 isoform X1 [Penaeus japonicus]|uniref:uncharacterized protein LOC122264660 isoform X1 n=1 Tax=Penaeus japonicus TaxID=27405 RepID=UPI001C71287B|nr:uncharacterized protein LOC122264660 isoform X1 [Penaeus japonicus]XP_042889611.1 uncharacterized protein LOC122264660 isoform X1 [Penaeus japonicus]XP_042889612.1 uncharacterized protein LOC122264660 isoform X1 [Penaeus japonicus]
MRSRMAGITKKFIGENRSGKEYTFMDKFRNVQASHVPHQDIFQVSGMKQLSEYSGGCSRIHNSPATYQAHQPLQENHLMPFSHETHSFAQPLTLPQASEYIHAKINSSQPSVSSNDGNQAILDTNSNTEVCDGNVLHGTSTTADPTINFKKDMRMNEMDSISKQERVNGREQWKKNIRKRKKNLGKSYTTQSGKEIVAKIFKSVNQCCCQQCFQNLNIKDQENVFTVFWNMGNWNKQTKFIWDHTEIKTKARKTSDRLSRRLHTRHFFLPDSSGNKIKVCKTVFLSLLQISNGRLSYTLSKKLVAVSDEEPQDRRGLQTPSNKTPAHALRDAEEYIQSSSYYNVKRDSGAKMLIVPQGVTIRKLYAAYQRNFVEAGKLAISLKVFRKLLPPILKKDALNMPFIFNQQVDESSGIYFDKCPANKTVIMKERVTISNEKGTHLDKLSRNRSDTLQNTTPVQGTKTIELNAHSMKSNDSALSPMNDTAGKCNQKLWQRKISKDLRDRGRSYISSSGKINWGKVFLPQYSCCLSKCHEAFPVEQQEILFNNYWALASWNLQTKFLWDHIQVLHKKAHTSKVDESRRIHTRIFFLPNNNGEKRKVCKILFCATLQVSNGRVSRAVSSKMVNPSLPPQDKRGKNAPQNKTTREDTLFVLGHIDQMLQHDNCLQSCSRKCSFLDNISKKKSHDMYKNSCLEHGKKPLSYTVYCRMLREDAYCPVEKTNSRERDFCT